MTTADKYRLKLRRVYFGMFESGAYLRHPALFHALEKKYHWYVWYCQSQYNG